MQPTELHPPQAAGEYVVPPADGDTSHGRQAEVARIVSEAFQDEVFVGEDDFAGKEREEAESAQHRAEEKERAQKILAHQVARLEPRPVKEPTIDLCPQSAV